MINFKGDIEDIDFQKINPAFVRRMQYFSKAL